MSRAPCIVAAFVAALLLSPSAVAVAQTVAGTVVEEGTGQPVAGAIVSLLDASGGERGAVLTDAVGEYEIGAPGAGRYRLRIERIGYRTVYTGWFDTGRGERVVRRVSVPVEAIEIPAIEVAVEDRCVTRPDAAETLGIVWGEARKAMVATRLSRRGIPRRFEIVRIERRLDPRTGFVLEERVLDREALGESPFRTRPAEEIAEEGWASVERERVWYFGPDVDALLSDDFLDRHCFRLVSRDDRIGLEFEPTGRGSRVEILGVLWLDRDTGELRVLEFGYVGLPYGVMEALASGQVEFERLDDGRWIVGRWRLRAPEIELQAGEPHVKAILEATAERRP